MLSQFVFYITLKTPLRNFMQIYLERNEMVHIIFGLCWWLFILGGSLHTIKVKAHTSVLANKQIGLDMLIKLST